MNFNQLQALGLADLGIAFSLNGPENDEDTRDVDQCHPDFYGTKGLHRGVLPQYVDRSANPDPETLMLASEACEDMLEELAEFGEVMGLDAEAKDALMEMLESRCDEQHVVVGPESVGVRITRNPEYSAHVAHRSPYMLRHAGRSVLIDVSCKPARKAVHAHPRSSPLTAKIRTHGKVRPFALNGGTPGAFGKK